MLCTNRLQGEFKMTRIIDTRRRQERLADRRNQKPTEPELLAKERNDDPEWTDHGKREWHLHPTKGWRNTRVVG